jgi:ribosomal protein S24E
MCDGSYIPYGDSKSQMGFAVFLNLESGAILARSHRDSTVSHSSFEIEIKALDELIRALVWVRGFLTELGYDQSEISTPIYIDNEAAIKVGNTYQLSEKTSHMVVRLNYIHQQVRNKTVVLKYIDTGNNVADTLTKALPIDAFIKHTDTLLHGYKGNPIVAQLTKSEQKLRGLPVTLKSAQKSNLKRKVEEIKTLNVKSNTLEPTQKKKKQVHFDMRPQVKYFFI